MEEIDYLMLTYDNRINPVNLFKTQQEFNDFINVPATKEDLQSCLKVFEEQGLYEWCIDINNKIINYGREERLMEKFEK